MQLLTAHQMTPTRVQGRAAQGSEEVPDRGIQTGPGTARPGAGKVSLGRNRTARALGPEGSWGFWRSQSGEAGGQRAIGGGGAVRELVSPVPASE